MSFIENLKKSLGFYENEEEEQMVLYDFQEEVDDFIEPQLSYDIILIRPQSMDDMVYVFDQITEENTPVIVDLGYLEEENKDAFQIAKDKIDFLRQEYNVESILLCKTVDKNMILIAPPRIEIVKKE